ncbi:PRD domain-containing protein [Spiroplasma eriocheiris]|uniref:Uncharacterized protein n=1 Tax=Spiroplasma eriocheiris TaxID=315358 RepID=A0A0H3XMF4_9MOLU|nr:PRD domain-containing protein [Spiroplasma eriocheiris]AHF57644.1 hypothetical protein SPE_0516 [Spiroplasma eriocheiris CCTCC M 207170]AKM54097.1 hypothetical protein SERIO_v1c05230 [Spiroplasma eriocheiris]
MGVDKSTAQMVIKNLVTADQYKIVANRYDIFENHILTFIDRFYHHQDLGFDLTSEIRAQIKPEFIKLATQFLNDLLKLLGEKDFKISEKEIFLVATHFANCEEV